MSTFKFKRNTEAGESAIQRGIARDPDAAEVPTETIRRMGRPPKTAPKEQVSIRYDADLVAAFRSTGTGWQTRMNDALRTFLTEHPITE